MISFSKTLTSVMALAAGIVAAPAVVQATTLNTAAAIVDISSPASTSRSDSDSQSVSFAQFDPSLGTLSSVQFSLSDVNTAIRSFLSFGGAQGGTGAAMTTATFTIQVPGGGGPTSVTLYSEQGTAETSCTTATNCEDGPPGAVTLPSFAPSALVDLASDLTPYVGLGSFDAVFMLDELMELQTCEGNSGQQVLCTASGEATWTATLSVNYNFTPASGDVPEPAILLLFGTALAGLGMMRRRL